MSTRADRPSSRFGGGPALRAGGAIVLGLATLLAWWTWPEPVRAPAASVPSVQPVAFDADALFAERIEPLIDVSQSRNDAAADRAVEFLQDRFDGYRAGVKPFVESVTSWRARFAIARRMPGDWWSKAFGASEERSDVERYVMGRFRAHIMDERSVEVAIVEAANTLAADLEANRNLLWTEIELALREADAPVVTPIGDFGAFQRAADLEASAMASRFATDSLVNGIATFAAGAAGGLVAEQAAAALLARLGGAASVSAAAGAAASGSAVAGGAGVGAGGGALGGPVGAVIGFGAGLAVGAVIDWKMTDAFQDRLEGELHAYLDELEAAVVNGTDENKGLRAALDEAVRHAAAAQKGAVLAKLRETAP